MTEVRVIRKRGSAPSGPRDGERLAAASDCARDHGLDADQVFYYAIYAIYKMPDGRLFPSPGVVASARTGAPIIRRARTAGRGEREGPELPADPTELRATRAGGGLGSGSGVRDRRRPGHAPLDLVGHRQRPAIVVARQGSPPQGPSDPMATTAIVLRATTNARMLDAHPADADAGASWAGSPIPTVGHDPGERRADVARRRTVAHPRL